MQRYICIHGHFYQPPRENPWLEEIELQDSAFPYHDWNERIANECYEPNRLARILDNEGRIFKIVNNYENISFNFGPTLLSWLERYMPKTYQGILEADRISQDKHNGHGNAMAQAYHHLIMPLANSTDKRSQIIWGIEDFKYRFQRQPEGMWLPETAVDLETLDIMAEHGILFTVLAPHQAKRVRKLNSNNWQDVSSAKIDPTMAYQLNLPSKRKMNIFFYDGPVSQAVAFEKLLVKGETFAERLQTIFDDRRKHIQLAHIATDGETYGHHHPYGEMALAYALQFIQEKKLAQITNYAEFLTIQPPSCEVEIYENTSWSCIHGIERWRNNCGCNSGNHSGWQQGWRKPLREALDSLRDALTAPYEKNASEYLKDPWKARDAYVQLSFIRNKQTINEFLDKYAKHKLSQTEKINTLKLLELQRHSMMMFTSCGWFFDEISGIETVQILNYAGRVIQLAESLLQTCVEKQFLSKLAQAASNIAEMQNGKVIYQLFVKSTCLDWHKIVAHYAISSIFEDYEHKTKIYCYQIHCQHKEFLVDGKTSLVLGKAKITSIITRSSSIQIFAALHFGDQNIHCVVEKDSIQFDYQAMAKEVISMFKCADFVGVIRLFGKHFKQPPFSISILFRDEQRKVLNKILSTSIEDIDNSIRILDQNYASLTHFVDNLNIPLPTQLKTITQYAINAKLLDEFSKKKVDMEIISELLHEAHASKITLDTENLAYILQKNIENKIIQFEKNIDDIHLLKNLVNLTSFIKKMPFKIKLWTAQNVCYRLLQEHLLNKEKYAIQNDGDTKLWLEEFEQLSQNLNIFTD